MPGTGQFCASLANQDHGWIFAFNQNGHSK